ncbi:hypothetical protein D0Z07_0810 [Hyphodiscus hymeniophilus]|uniref:Myb-like domain-containing protein n=1 Tax=Hyphodiscus hymeniophilus TaxID=353542 RepID=A0A9P6VQ90_9HELO|nr:hypothetical protein D0Z07_0810 [Hyphodiscus hymeniophilus]
MAGNSEPDREIKLSPSTLSPSFHMFPNEDDFSSGKYDHNPPMKHKSPSGALGMSAWDNPFPESPLCPPPFYPGSYGVSTVTPVSGQSEPSPLTNTNSPHLHSAGGFSNSSSLNPQSYSTQSLPSFRRSSQPPKLIAPTPSALRPATKQDGHPHRQASLQSTSTAASSMKTEQEPFTEPLGSLPPKGKKRKSPTRDSMKHMVIDEDKMTAEEKVLFDLKLNKQLVWKDIERKWEEIHGKFKGEAALQMQFGRAVKRLRLWTDIEEQALSLAVKEFDKNKWETISRRMLEHGCLAKWPKEFCERKWQEMNPEDEYASQHDFHFRDRGSGNWDPNEEAFSDEMTEAATMDEVGSRAASDASSQMFHLRHQQRLQNAMFEEQHRHNGWEAEG